MDIEEVAAHSPEKIHVELVDPLTGFMPFQGRRLAFKLGLAGAAHKRAVQFFQALYQAFVDTVGIAWQYRWGGGL